MCSFYPGLASPNLPAIGAGANTIPTGRIGAPLGFGMDGETGFGMDARDGIGLDNGNGSGAAHKRRIAASRPVRVVGVLDHPVTPMPPVSCSPISSGARMSDQWF